MKQEQYYVYKLSVCNNSINYSLHQKKLYQAQKQIIPKYDDTSDLLGFFEGEVFL